MVRPDLRKIRGVYYKSKNGGCFEEDKMCRRILRD